MSKASKVNGVVVDHKTYHGAEPTEAATRYGTQLSHYSRAVEHATGTPVIETLINFVLLGTVYNLQEV